jgi:hypothetical protein
MRRCKACLPRLRFGALLLLAASLPLARAPYGWSTADEVDTGNDPWTPCERTIGGTTVRGFCRLGCTAKWSYAPERMDCPMLSQEALLARSHSRGLERFQQMSQDSFSKVNSGVSALGAADPDTA